MLIPNINYAQLSIKKNCTVEIIIINILSKEIYDFNYETIIVLKS
jgi:hypothetical protein